MKKIIRIPIQIVKIIILISLLTCKFYRLLNNYCN